MKFFISILVLCFLLASSCTKDIGPNTALLPESCDSIRYNKHVKPIISNYCTISGCHVTGAQSPDLTDSLTIQSQAEQIRSLVVQQHAMPPSGYPQLSKQELNSLHCWLNAGAPFN
jgi:uncharacterized membrane protein